MNLEAEIKRIKAKLQELDNRVSDIETDTEDPDPQQIGFELPDTDFDPDESEY